MIKKELGNLGEQISSEFLIKNGLKIIERNFYCKQGEIDIIARDNEEIVFVEVKTRTNSYFGKPAEAVNYKKVKHLYKVAKYYLYKNKLKDVYMRFDVLEVYILDGKVKINHIKQIL